MKLIGHVDEVSHSHVTGWAADADHPGGAVSVQIVVDGEVRGEIAAAAFRHGLRQVCPGATGQYEFKYQFSPPVSVTEPHVLEVIEATTGQLVANGRRWLPAAGGVRPQRIPILITSTGRSGTTMLMHEFARRRGIVVAHAYPFEVKLASYAAATLKVLTHPQPATRSEANEFPDLAFRDLRAVPNPWHQPELSHGIGGPQLAHFLRDTAPRRLESTFRNMVLEYYGITAVAQNKQAAPYFAEKLTLNKDLRHAVREMFGPVREIVLVRDPRDYLCSARSFWKAGWSESLQTLRTELPVIEALYGEKQPDVLFVRYEDLVHDPDASRAAIDRFLDLPAEAHAAPDETIRGRHATTENVTASIGRWRSELSAEQAGECREHFRRFMETFGYG